MNDGSPHTPTGQRTPIGVPRPSSRGSSARLSVSSGRGRSASRSRSRSPIGSGGSQHGDASVERGDEPFADFMEEWNKDRQAPTVNTGAAGLVSPGPSSSLRRPASFHRDSGSQFIIPSDLSSPIRRSVRSPGVIGPRISTLSGVRHSSKSTASLASPNGDPPTEPRWNIGLSMVGSNGRDSIASNGHDRDRSRSPSPSVSRVVEDSIITDAYKSAAGVTNGMVFRTSSKASMSLNMTK